MLCAVITRLPSGAPFPVPASLSNLYALSLKDDDDADGQEDLPHAFRLE